MLRLGQIREVVPGLSLFGTKRLSSGFEWVLEAANELTSWKKPKQRRQPLGWVAPLLPNTTRPTIFFVLGTLARMSGHNLDWIKYALHTAQQNGFRYVKIKSDGQVFSAVFEVDALGDLDSQNDLDLSSLAAITPQEMAFEVKSTSVGYFSSTKLAGAIEEGDVIGVVTALGVGHEVISSKGGTIELLVGDGEAVQYGQVVAKVISE